MWPVERLDTVGSKKQVFGDEIRVSGVGKPTNTPNQTLISLFLSFQSKRIIGLCRFSNRVDGYPRAIIGSHSEGLISVLEGGTFDKVCSKTGLVEMDGDQQWSDPPWEVNSKKPVNNPHIIYLAPLTKKMTEKGLHHRIFQKVDEIVNIETKWDGRLQFCARRIWRVDNKARIETRIFEGRSETNGAKCGIDFIIPMSRASQQAINCQQKEPILLGISIRVIQRGTDNRDLVGRKNTLTKGIFAVTLTKWASFLDGQTYEETEGLIFKDRHKLFGFGPKAVFVITKDYDARFSAIREQILVLLDCKDAHGRDSMRSPFLLKGAIFAKSDCTIFLERLKATFFFLITHQPTILVQVWISKRH
jgi:hypothetical protein